jgi:hypothetical protein
MFGADTLRLERAVRLPDFGERVLRGLDGLGQFDEHGIEAVAGMLVARVRLRPVGERERAGGPLDDRHDWVSEASVLERWNA